jgi:biopolymer transport protein ExbD
MAEETPKKKKRKHDFFAEDTVFEMPMSQMIDCVFLLLIFFMSVSTIDEARHSKDVELPVAKNAAVEQDESDRAVIDLEWNEIQYSVVLKMQGNPYYEARDIVPPLEQFSRLHPVKGRVVIRADRQVPYEFTQEVLAAVGEANIASVLFSTLETELPARVPAGGG